MDKKISNKFIYFFGSFGGILFGYDIGVMTGALPFLQTDWSLSSSSSLVGWITSAVMLGPSLGVHWLVNYLTVWDAGRLFFTQQLSLLWDLFSRVWLRIKGRSS